LEKTRVLQILLKLLLIGLTITSCFMVTYFNFLFLLSNTLLLFLLKYSFSHFLCKSSLDIGTKISFFSY